MTKNTPSDLSVVVAAYNEEAIIEASAAAIIAALGGQAGYTWELIFVNDGSTDATGPLLDELAERDSRIRVIHHRRNFGQGRALRTAFDICRGEVVVTLDADLSYAPENIFRLTEALRQSGAEIALASPYCKGGSVRNVPWGRLLLSRLGNMYLSWMSHYAISTSTCVVRAYRRAALDSLVLTSDGMELQIEVLTKAAIMGFRACELPAHLEWRAPSSGPQSRVSKLRIFKTMQMFLILGWLSKPALVVMLLSLLMLMPGAYMALVLAWRILQEIMAQASNGLIAAVSLAMRNVFAQYTYSVIFGGALLLIGLQMLAFSLLMLQSKFYFEELYRLGQVRAARLQSPPEGPGH